MMEFQEEVDHSDDGSYVFVDFNDYAEDIDQNTEANASSNKDLSNDHSGLQDPTNDDKENEEDEDEGEVEEEYSDCPEAKKRKCKSMASHRLKEVTTIKQVAKTHILHYLPGKSLAKCHAVSKEWNSWISNPFFIHSQSQHFSQTSGFFQDENEDKTIGFLSLHHVSYGVPYPSLPFLPKKTSIKSSCNGLLLCQSINDDDENYVCNPVNKQWVELPSSSYYHGKEAKSVLAFEPSSLNFEPFYQVVCPFSIPGDQGNILYFDIYDSKTKSWKTSDEICLDLDASNIKSDGIFVNGVVYWETTCGKLLAFDIKNEIYGIQPLPELGGALSKIDGEICYVEGRYRHSIEMCELRVYHGGLMSLKNTISFGVPSKDVAKNGGNVVNCRVLGNSHDVVGVILKKSEWQDCLFVYNFKYGKVNKRWCPLRGSSNKLFPYVNSLVSLAA